MFDFLKKDKFVFGLALGVLVPIPISIILIGILTTIQFTMHYLQDISGIQMVLVSMAFNLLLMRYYLVKLKYENTGKGLLLITLLLIVVILAFFSRTQTV